MRVVIDLAAELRRFVPPGDGPHVVEFPGRRSVKDLVESLGVPHVEIGRVEIDGAPARLEQVIGADAASEMRIRVEAPDSAGLRLLPARFAADGHLGRLAAYLRALGCDTLHRAGESEADFVARASSENRIVLSRDVALLKLAAVRHGAFVRATDPHEQLAEIAARFGLASRSVPFTRCLRCNDPLVAATKDAVARLVPPRVLARFNAFERCPGCGGVYWPGTHRERLERVIAPYL